MSDKEKYTLGYGEGAMQWMTSRTADEFGTFLLPYLSPGMRFLDCGCGPGTLTVGFAQRVAPGETIGIDQETSQSAASLEKARQQGIHNLDFDTGDIYHLPYEDESFDVVFASAVLGSVAKPERVIAEMARVLKPGGIMACKEFDHGGDIIYPQSPILEHSTELYHRLRAHNGHEPFGGRRLKGLLHEAGCKIDYLHAFYAQNLTAEELHAHVARNNYLISEILCEQYESLGWCTAEEVEEQARAWVEFADNPEAVFLSAWFEAVGIKIST